MKKQNNLSGRIILLTSIATIFLLGASVSAFAQTGIGKSYGTRDPRTDCGDLKGAAPTQAIALKSFICHREQERYPNIWLVEGASVQVGVGRSYNMKEDYNVPEIDVRAKVYPIRGNFKNYQCNPLSNILHNQGKNCLMSVQPKAGGLCYKNTWGEWLCSMSGNEPAVVSPPPGGEKATTAGDTQTTTKKTDPEPKNDKKNADDPNDKKTGDGQADSPFPKPDFSELEKYVDVIRYEYGDNVTDNNLYIVVKSKSQDIPQFCVQFLDKDGIMVDPQDSKCGTGIHMGTRRPGFGQTAKFDVNMPPGNDMKRVVSVRIVANP